MNLTEIRIIKRDGKQENFSAAKITNAIGRIATDSFARKPCDTYSANIRA